MERSRSKLDIFSSLQVRDNEASRNIERLINKDRSVDWVAITSFQHGWLQAGGGVVVSFSRDYSGVVHLKGEINSGVVDQIAFVLPVGFRPGYFFRVPVVSNGVFGRIQIATNGEVTPRTPSNNAYVDFSGISFRAEN